MQSEIRRVLEGWNTPARLVPFLYYSLCIRDVGIFQALQNELAIYQL